MSWKCGGKVGRDPPWRSFSGHLASPSAVHHLPVVLCNSPSLTPVTVFPTPSMLFFLRLFSLLPPFGCWNPPFFVCASAVRAAFTHCWRCGQSMDIFLDLYLSESTSQGRVSCHSRCRPACLLSKEKNHLPSIGDRQRSISSVSRPLSPGPVNYTSPNRLHVSDEITRDLRRVLWGRRVFAMRREDGLLSIRDLQFATIGLPLSRRLL